MSILHHALRIIFNIHAQMLPVTFVPYLRKLIYGYFVCEEVSFKVESYDNVESIRDLVCLNTNL